MAPKAVSLDQEQVLAFQKSLCGTSNHFSDREEQKTDEYTNRRTDGYTFISLPTDLQYEDIQRQKRATLCIKFNEHSSRRNTISRPTQPWCESTHGESDITYARTCIKTSHPDPNQLHVCVLWPASIELESPWVKSKVRHWPKQTQISVDRLMHMNRHIYTNLWKTVLFLQATLPSCAIGCNRTISGHSDGRYGNRSFPPKAPY